MPRDEGNPLGLWVRRHDEYEDAAPGVTG